MWQTNVLCPLLVLFYFHFNLFLSIYSFHFCLLKFWTLFWFLKTVFVCISNFYWEMFVWCKARWVSCGMKSTGETKLSLPSSCTSQQTQTVSAFAPIPISILRVQCVCVCAMCVCYPAVIVQQTSGDDGVEEDLVGGYDVIQVLSPLHFVPKLVPGTFQHLDKRNQSMTKPIKMDDLVTLTFEKKPLVLDGGASLNTINTFWFHFLWLFHQTTLIGGDVRID